MHMEVSVDTLSELYKYNLLVQSIWKF